MSPGPSDMGSPDQTGGRRDWEWVAIALMMLIGATLSFRVFFPHLRDIVMFDEAYYIDLGQQLAGAHVPKLAQNPLVALFWGVTALPFRSSPSWMMHACGLGRFLIFGLLWAGLYAVARQLRGYVHPLAPAAFLLVTPGLFELLNNSSDGMFAALSAFALARFIAFLRAPRLARGIGASCLLGLAALARNDGLVLGAVAAALTIVSSSTRPHRLRCAGAILLPALVMVGGYVVVHGACAGAIDSGLARRTYDAFEQGEGVASYERYGQRNPYVEGYDAARRLYGSPEENRYSILKAVARNPSAFGRRVFAVVSQMPAQASAAYGRGLRGMGLVLFLLVVRGGCFLWRRDRSLLLVLLLWCGHLAVYLLTFYREAYFLLVYAPVFFLAALGARALFADGGAPREMIRAGVALLGLTAYGLVVRNSLIAWPGAAFLLGVLAVWVVRRNLPLGGKERDAAMGVGAVVLLFALQGQFARPARLSLPHLPRLGENADEQAARFMAGAYPSRTPVASYTIAPIVMAGMHYVAPHIEARWIASGEDLLSWASHRGVHVFYVDRNLLVCEPRLWEIMEGLIGAGVQVAFRAEDEFETVFVLTDGAVAPGARR